MSKPPKHGGKPRAEGGATATAIHSQGRVFQGHDELNARNVPVLEAHIIGDEKIHTCSSGAHQLHGIGSAKGAIRIADAA